MSLINQINGALLKELQERYPTSSSGGSSIGMGAAFDSDQLNISTALDTVCDIFTLSYQRVSNPYSGLNAAQQRLDKAEQALDDLYDLATKAADSGLSDNDRASLETEFRKTIRTLNSALTNDEIIDEDEDLDPMKTDDLGEILEDAGVDLMTSSKIVQAYKSVGGSDKTLGEETITLADGSRISASDLHISTEKSAEQAVEYIDALRDVIATDNKGLTDILGELKGAAEFALTAVNTFTKASEDEFKAGNLDTLANLLVADLRANSDDAALNAHSDVDAILAQQLLDEYEE